ncbi:MAG TPA: SRPBCC family protein [Thermoleophilaceae bacterium]|nr:SRPBCC family protein [Thermoleophilaceae bacterium]
MTVEQKIGRPPEEVAAYAMDPANDRDWIGALTRVEVLGDGPVAPGTRVRRVARFLGRDMEYVNEITELTRPKRLAMKSVKAPFPMTVTYQFEPDGAGTLMRIHTGGDASGFYKMATPVLSAMVRRGVASDLKRLKQRLEA